MIVEAIQFSTTPPSSGTTTPSVALPNWRNRGKASRPSGPTRCWHLTGNLFWQEESN